jgi:hypothetical protein
MTTHHFRAPRAGMTASDVKKSEEGGKKKEHPRSQHVLYFFFK